MGLDAAAYAALLGPRVGVLPDDLMIERLRTITGATVAEAMAALGFDQPSADFTITAGQAGSTIWYSRRGSQVIGSAAGDLTFGGNTADRVQISSSDLLVNAIGFGIREWIEANPMFAFELTFLDDAGQVLTYEQADLDGTPGGGFVRFATSANDRIIFSRVSVGERIRVRIRADGSTP